MKTCRKSVRGLKGDPASLPLLMPGGYGVEKTLPLVMMSQKAIQGVRLRM